MAKILDGIAVSKKLREKLKYRLDEWYPELYKRPQICLAVILCSDDPASEVYVRHKQRACEEVGITSVLLKPFEGGIKNYSNPQAHLMGMIDWLNEDPNIHGILVQLPLPTLDINQQAVFDRINPLKDVDVFNPTNVGLLMQGRPRFVPCTPHAVQELLHHSGYDLDGKSVCIINRSDIVGKPLSALLVHDGIKANATVKVCHDHTPPEVLANECKNSDVIVVAVGKQNFLTPDMVGEHSIVVDVGINRIKGSKKICGDCHEGIYDIVQAYSPVPGGVGPVTVTMLLHNTIKSFIALNNH